MVLKSVSYSDGANITVDDFIKDPLRIPELILQISEHEFIADSLLRSAGNNDAGVVKFHESTPLFAEEGASIRSEFGEVVVVPTSVGVPKVAYSVERALALMISDEMRRRRNVDDVMRQVTQIKNSMTQTWDKVFMDAIVAAAGHSVTATRSWATNHSTDDAQIRHDVNSAVFEIENSTADADQNSPFGFEPDTLVINRVTKFNLINSKDYNSNDIYRGNIASENLRYTGKLPQKFYDLDVVVSRQCPDDTAIVLQRGRAGFISNELGLQATPLYRDEPRKTWRSDVQRASAVGFDQPKAIALITGVGTTQVPADETA